MSLRPAIAPAIVMVLLELDLLATQSSAQYTLTMQAPPACPEPR